MRLPAGLEIFKDISELKRLQEEVAKREKKYRRIFEGSHDMIYTTNQRGEILDINQAGVEMLNFPSKEEMLKTVSARKLYRNTLDRDRFLAEINRRGQVKDYEVEFKKRDGAAMHALISSRRYQNPETGDTKTLKPAMSSSKGSSKILPIASGLKKRLSSATGNFRY
jgi:PAS domain S-box-containing protein